MRWASPVSGGTARTRPPSSGSCSTCSRSTPGTSATWTSSPSSPPAPQENKGRSSLAVLLGHALVQALAQALDPGAQQVARLQVHRGLTGVAHPAAGAGGDQVAGPQRDRLAGVGNDPGR